MAGTMLSIQQTIQARVIHNIVAINSALLSTHGKLAFAASYALFVANSSIVLPIFSAGY